MKKALNVAMRCTTIIVAVAINGSVTQMLAAAQPISVADRRPSPRIINN
jgi:hypothetical protein